MTTLSDRVILLTEAIREKCNLLSGRIDDIESATGLILDKVYVYRNSSYTTVSAAWGTIPMNAVKFDTNNLWDPTNALIVPKRPGYYLCSCRLRTNTSGGIAAAFVINDNRYVVVGTDGGTGLYASGGTDLIYCNGTTDYLKVQFYTSSARAVSIYSSDTHFSVVGPF